MDEWTRDEYPKVRWYPSDLDRCEHGRHSIDSCYDCPNGQSRGNPYLDPTAGPRMRETRMDRNQIRIGTMVHGEPIWVTYRRMPCD
jgi:hypothetical protein